MLFAANSDRIANWLRGHAIYALMDPKRFPYPSTAPPAMGNGCDPCARRSARSRIVLGPNAVNSTYWSKCIDTATDELDLAKVVANRQQFEADREWFKAELLDAIRSWEEVTEAALAI